MSGENTNRATAATAELMAVIGNQQQQIVMGYKERIEDLMTALVQSEEVRQQQEDDKRRLLELLLRMEDTNRQHTETYAGQLTEARQGAADARAEAEQVRAEAEELRRELGETPHDSDDVGWPRRRSDGEGAEAAKIRAEMEALMVAEVARVRKEAEAQRTDLETQIRTQQAVLELQGLQQQGLQQRGLLPQIQKPKGKKLGGIF